MRPTHLHRVPTLGYIFLRIGAAAFGGLGASLALIDRELVTKRQWLTAADVTAALTYTKLLPGSTGPQVVAYLGYTLGGWFGSAVATAAFLFPAALMMLVLAAAYVSVTAAPVMRPALTGLTAAIVGVLLATTYRMGKANILGSPHVGTRCLASMVAGAVLGISAAVIVVLAGLVSRSAGAAASKQEAQEDTHDTGPVHPLYPHPSAGLRRRRAALPLIEGIVVAETGWVSAQDFATAVAFGYITPGPCSLP